MIFVLQIKTFIYEFYVICRSINKFHAILELSTDIIQVLFHCLMLINDGIKKCLFGKPKSTVEINHTQFREPFCKTDP